MTTAASSAFVLLPQHRHPSHCMPMGLLLLIFFSIATAAENDVLLLPAEATAVSRPSNAAAAFAMKNADPAARSVTGPLSSQGNALEGAADVAAGVADAIDAAAAAATGASGASQFLSHSAFLVPGSASTDSSAPKASAALPAEASAASKSNPASAGAESELREYKEEAVPAGDEGTQPPPQAVPGQRTPWGGGPPSVLGRHRLVSAPFVRHYSKHMAILWEWYTKTIGATMNGKRKQDEDALVVHAPAHWKANVRFKAIFDGHGGPAVSRTCVAQFCNYFGNMPDLSAETFKRTSLLLDAVIRSDAVRHERGGSTGLVVAIERPDDQIPKFKIHTSNIGDSRAFILHRNGTYTIMSKDHKPSDPEEVARITRAGGFVARVRKVFRVDGVLSLSRAFGDIKVVAVPDVRTFEASEGDYIFMACDGMFEAPGMSWDFVANLLQRELHNTKDNLVETAFRMLNTAYLLGSADNISIVLTKLMNRKRSSSVVKRFTYDFSGKREFVETQLLTSPNEYRSGTYHTPGGPVVTLF